MADKPDVAALVDWLQTWSPVTANGKRAHLAASELTRLAAENRTYAEAHAFNSARFAEMLSERDGIGASLKDEVEVRLNAEHERDQAKAEIARLNASLTVTAQEYAFLKDAYDELKLDTEKAEAEIARLTEENAELKEFDLIKSDAEWREIYEDISKSAGYQRGRADRAEAELSEAKATIERLRELLKPFAESAAYHEIFGIYGGVPVRHLRDARDALKPDTGKKP